MRSRTIRRSILSVGCALAVALLTPAVLAAQEKIAFETQRDGNHEIYVMNADGTNQLRLTFNPADDSEPAFSPGGGNWGLAGRCHVSQHPQPNTSYPTPRTLFLLSSGR